MGWGWGVSCRSGGAAVIGSWTYFETEFYFGTKSAESLCLFQPHLICSIYILQSHHCNQVCASINMLMFQILFNSHLSGDHALFQIFKILLYSQFVPRSQFHLKLCRVFPNQLGRAWISHVCPCWCESLPTRTLHCSKGRNWGKNAAGD